MVGTIDWPSGRVCAPAGIRVRRGKGTDMSNGMPRKDAVLLPRSGVDGGRDPGLSMVALDARWSLSRACFLYTTTR